VITTNIVDYDQTSKLVLGVLGGIHMILYFRETKKRLSTHVEMEYKYRPQIMFVHRP
jgi:hypothetical protein